MKVKGRIQLLLDCLEGGRDMRPRCSLVSTPGFFNCTTASQAEQNVTYARKHLHNENKDTLNVADKATFKFLSTTEAPIAQRET